jgi:23S rRNA pseudoU1915 N3-methylase RlmH
MKICLLFFAGLLWIPVTTLPTSAQLIHQDKCREYQKNFNNFLEVRSRLKIAHSQFQEEHPLIKALQEEQERLSKLLQKKEASYYLLNKCRSPNSSTSEPVMGLW